MIAESERQRMIKELEGKMPGFNVATRAALNQQIKQFERLEPMLGKEALMRAIGSQTVLNQDMKDYIYLRMKWL